MAAAAAAVMALPLGVHSVWIINKSGGLIFQKVRGRSALQPGAYTRSLLSST